MAINVQGLKKGNMKMAVKRPLILLEELVSQ